MTEQEFAEMVDDALMNGYIEAECRVCGNEITVEPDATTGYCEVCGKVQKVKNFLIDAGLM